MGLSMEEALGALRLTLGRWTREDEVDEASKLVAECIKTVTKASRQPPFQGLADGDML